MALSSFRIVAGNNGVPVSLPAISPPLFLEFGTAESIATEFHDYVARELDGNRLWVTIGLPWVKVTLYHVSRVEYAILKTYEGLVTIRCLNQSTNVYHIYNASCRSIENHADSKWTGPDGMPGWGDVTMTFYDLQVLS